MTLFYDMKSPDVSEMSRDQGQITRRGERLRCIYESVKTPIRAPRPLDSRLIQIKLLAEPGTKELSRPQWIEICIRRDLPRA
jgi:hypothetical protein